MIIRLIPFDLTAEQRQELNVFVFLKKGGNGEPVQIIPMVHRLIHHLLDGCFVALNIADVSYLLNYLATI